ncbi:HAD-IA family hydrolase [Mesorhizobium sp. LHD-90]|uniref:HAD-IA family hydrolase n=1 Tax=Mesorhizobium sp. LHD-90 TaxID=3071414 RepID=UPI0027E145ED|nr:HAD-IA family hydrolase [Mesorhizobium sp. LHD-90]MDQ6434897.1 HAD-IA family hydrolase [Mesorhizobium sp. LHD-90]
MTRLVLFDCDGTLVDSAAVIHGCMERAFAEAGLAAPDLAATKSVIGLTLNLAIAQMLGREVDPAIDALAERYKHHFHAMRGEADFSEPLYPGIAMLVAELAKRDDILVGMVTGKSRRGVQAVFSTHGFGEAFLVVRTAEDCPSKPHPAMVLECCAFAGVDPASTFVVGDAIYDMQMARSAGARAIGVGWGYHDARALMLSGAERVLQEPAELMPLLA